MKNYSKGILATGILLVLSGCGGGGDSGSKSGVAGKVRLGQFGSDAVSFMTAPKWGDIKASSGNYSWAKVDGLKIQLVAINGTSKGKSENFMEFGSPKTLELGGDTAVIKLNENISVPEGDYTDAGIRFRNHAQLKAFCRTTKTVSGISSAECLYTTASGVKKTTTCSDNDSLPADYDYFTVGKMHPDPHYGNEIMEYNKWNYSVSADQTPYLNILVDTSYTVSCANSTADLDDVNGETKLAPFNWGLESGKMSDYYKGAEGNFGFGYIPLFTYLSTTADEALPAGETYASTTEESELPVGDESFNMLTSFITTVAFKDDGQIIAARSRNFGMGGAGLEQGWSGFEKSSSFYSMLNGEHYSGAKGDYSDARWLADRKVEGFSRSTNFTSVQELDVTNGPDCGQNLNDRNKACLSAGGEIKTYWKRIRR